MEDADRSCCAGSGNDGAGLQGHGTEQRLLERDDDPLPMPRLHREQIAGTWVLLLHHACRRRPDRPPLPLHGP